LVDFGRSMKQPPIDIVTGKDLGKVRKENPVVFLYLGEAGPSFRIFQDIAYRLQGQFKFVAEDRAFSGSAEEKEKDKDKLGFKKKADKKLLTALQIDDSSTPLVVELSKGSEEDKFTGPWTLTALKEFILNHKLPLISNISGSNFEDVTQTGQKTLLAVIKTDDPHSDIYLASLYPLAKLYKDEVVFATIDGVQFNDYVERFGFTEEDIPTMFVLDAPNEFYWLPKNKNIDVTQQQEFIDGVLSGVIPAINVHPWYSPTRYTKWLSKNVDDTQLMMLAVITTIAFSALLIFGCIFAGRDLAPTNEAPRHSAVPTGRTLVSGGSSQKGKAKPE